MFSLLLHIKTLTRWQAGGKQKLPKAMPAATVTPAALSHFAARPFAITTGEAKSYKNTYLVNQRPSIYKLRVLDI